MLWSEATAAHLFQKMFENILATNQEICYSLHSTTEGPFHVSFPESTNMAASLGQVLVLFLRMVFSNHFSVSSNRNAPIKYLLSSILFELQTTVKAQQMVQLLLQEESQQETARYMDYISLNLDPKPSRNYSRPFDYSRQMMFVLNKRRD